MINSLSILKKIPEDQMGSDKQRWTILHILLFVNTEHVNTSSLIIVIADTINKNDQKPIFTKS